MKLSSKELKRQARECLMGHYGLAMGAFAILELIVVAVFFPFNMTLQSDPSDFQLIVYTLAALIISLLSTVLSCGLLCIHLNIARKKDTKLSDLFRFFTTRPDRILVSGLLLMGILFLAMLPAILATIIAVFFDAVLFYLLLAVIWIGTIIVTFMLSYSYSLIYLILIDHPEYGIMKVFRESHRLMKGNKGRMFYINLSFLGLNILGLLSCYIGLLWVSPYMSQTSVEFYRNVIGEI